MLVCTESCCISWASGAAKAVHAARTTLVERTKTAFLIVHSSRMHIGKLLPRPQMPEAQGSCGSRSLNFKRLRQRLKLFDAFVIRGSNPPTPVPPRQFRGGTS